MALNCKYPPLTLDIRTFLAAILFRLAAITRVNFAAEVAFRSHLSGQ